MAKNNYWLKSGIINIFQNLLTVLFGFLSFYILVRVLKTKDEYGTWTLFLSVVTVFESARNGLTQEAMVKYLSSANMLDKKKITTATFTINFVMTLFLIVLVLIIGPLLSSSWKAPEINVMLHLYLIVFVFSGILNQLNCIEQASLNFTGIFYSNIARQFIFFVYVLYIYTTKSGTNVINLAIVQIISVFIATVIATIYTRKKIRYTRKIDLNWIKKIFNFGKYTFGVSLSSIIAGSVDQMMLGSLLSKAASGSFNIAIRITNLTDIPTNAMVAIVYPQSSIKMAKEGNESVKYLYERSVGVILAILTPIVLFTYFFSDFIIHFIAGNRYEDSIPLLRVTLLTCLFSPYGRQAGTILNSTGKVKFNFYMVILTVITLIVFNFIFINLFGVIGAAYGSLIATIISFAISQVYMNKFYKINILNPWIYAYKFYPEFLSTYILKKKKS